MTTLTEAELLAALQQAQPVEGESVPPNTFSGPDMMAAWGWGYAKWSRHIKAWLQAGVCRVVEVRKFGVDGRLSRVKAYQFTTPKKAKRG